MEISRNTIFWHIGFPKTATTSFQKFIFPSIKEINYLGWNYLDDPVEKKQRNAFVSLLREITIWHSRGHLLEHPHTLNDLLNKSFPFPLQYTKNFLVSDESVISRALVPQKQTRLLKFVSPLESIERLTRLSRASGLNPKFILVLRRQEDLLESLYAQAATELRERLDVKTLSEYIDIVFNTYGNDEPMSALKYFNLVKDIESLVGHDHLLVLPYELIRSNFDAFKTRLGAFLDLKDFDELDQLKTRRTNVKSSDRGKLVNQIQLSTTIKRAIFGDISFGGLGKRLKFLEALRSKHVSLSESEADFVRAQFSEQNSNLLSKFPYFKDLGY